MISQLKEKVAIIIDVRSPAEFAQGANKLSINIPLDNLETRIGEFEKDATLILCCASGGRSAVAANMFKSHGFKNVTNAGPWTNTL